MRSYSLIRLIIVFFLPLLSFCTDEGDEETRTPCPPEIFYIFPEESGKVSGRDYRIIGGRFFTEKGETLVFFDGRPAEILDISRKECDDCDDCKGSCDECLELCQECDEVIYLITPEGERGEKAVVVINYRGTSDPFTFTYLAECEDNEDNDGDELIDLDDLECQGDPSGSES